MTNRLEINWKIDGFIDEQRYYRSEISIDPENLPPPSAVLMGDVRTHVDTEIEIGKTYYVRVCSVRNGIEKISSEVQVSTGDIYFNSVDLLIFADATTLPSSNIVDSSSHARAITNSGATIQNVNNVLPKFDDAILLLKSSNKMSCAIQPLLTNDFTIEFFAAIPSSTNDWPRFFTLGDFDDIRGESNQLNFQFSDSGRVEVYGWTGSALVVSYETIISQVQSSFISNNLKHGCFMRKDGIFYCFVDGVLQSINSKFKDYSITKNVIRFHPQANSVVSKYINSFRITNGIARYNEAGFSIRNQKFLDY